MFIVLGFIAGAVFGAIFGHGPGILAGGIIGAILGLAWKQRGGIPAERIEQLERRTQQLGEQVQRALGRLERLEAAARSAPVSVSIPPEPVSASAVPEVRVDAGPGIAPPVALAQQDKPVPYTPSRPLTPPAPPTAFDNFLAAIKNWFLGGNTVVRAGIVVLFFGLAFLLKYAYEHAHVPPELRIAGVALGGVALLILGWRLRLRREGYAWALQGGGVGALYLTIFAALRLYQLLPPKFAFGLLLCIAALSAVLAVLQNAQALAILGASGGFLAPVLASTGEGSHVMLFSYYALLNAGILGIAWFKAWRPLNLTGFLFTFGIGLAWGAKYYRPEFFWTTEPFLIGFFSMYLGVSVLFAFRQAPRLKHYLDSTLIFGLPIVAFGMQTRLVTQYEYGAATSALCASLVYLVLARVLYAKRRDALRALVESFLALGIVFATLAIPLALDGRWTSAAWALEGAALLWVGIRQERLLARVFGLFLQLAAAGAFISRFDLAPIATPVVNSFFLGALFLSVAGLFSNWIMDKHREGLRGEERAVMVVAFWWGVLWWGLAGISEIDRQVMAALRAHAVLIFVTLSCLAFGIAHRSWNWRLAQFPMLGLIPAASLVLIVNTNFSGRHPSAALGWLAWPVWIATHFWLLKRHESQFIRLSPWLHAAGLWLVAIVGAWELGFWFDFWVASTTVWGLIAWMLVPTAMIVTLTAQGERLAWPVATHRKAYLLYGPVPLTVFLGLWLIYSTATNDGNPAPLPYVPVLSPLDLAQLGALVAALSWFKDCVRKDLIVQPGSQRLFYVLLGVASFICANGILLRTLRHHAGVPFNFEQMLSSMLVQASFSIFWTVLALCTMVSATRMQRRALWITGAGLMGVVVVKLFLVDLSNIGGVERIVSFTGVGLLMLVVGYFSPVPPKKAAIPA